MIPMILALIHGQRVGCRVWSEVLIYPGGSRRVWMCDCQKRWPSSLWGPKGDPIRREHPDDDPWRNGTMGG